jgi:hypothetical protein
VKHMPLLGVHFFRRNYPHFLQGRFRQFREMAIQKLRVGKRTSGVADVVESVAGQLKSKKTATYNATYFHREVSKVAEKEL